MRAQPSTEAEILLVIPYQAVLTATMRAEAGWYRVVYENNDGWVFGGNVTLEASCVELGMTTS